jgi:hypothetical protein
MNYKVMFFRDAQMFRRDSVSAKSHKEAIRKAAAKVPYLTWQHSVVVGSTVRRYTSKLKVLSGEVSVFRTKLSNSYGIILMIGKYTEIRLFPSQEIREKVFEQCMTLASAASVEAEPEQTNTTVSSSETSGSKSGSTSKKISNGSVTSATCQDLLTRYSIEESFGSDSADVSVKTAWRDGSSRSRSRRPMTLLATVKNLERFEDVRPGVTRGMKALSGKTIKVKKMGKNYIMVIGDELSWLFAEEWLDFSTATVEIMFGGSIRGQDEYMNWEDSMNKHIGKTVKMRFCSGTHFSYQGCCFDVNWLSVTPVRIDQKPIDAIVKEVPLHEEKNGVKFVQDMQRLSGQLITVTKKKDGNYLDNEHGWTFHKSWLSFMDSPDSEYPIQALLNQEGKGKMKKFLKDVDVVLNLKKIGKDYTDGMWSYSSDWLDIS